MNRAANSLARRLKSHGFEVYFVGGAVRDKFLGRPYHDIDIATNATPDQVISIFQRIYTVVPTGLKHGTVTVVVGGNHYEITTYRSDVETDGRHAEVKFVKTIQQDLQRRDFTVNAMALDLDGNLIDPFDGRLDLERGVIRAVGAASVRMEEDYLRMLRAVRFAAGLGTRFELDMKLRAAIINGAPNLSRISEERKRDELMKMLANDNVLFALQDLVGLGLMAQIMPEMKPAVGHVQNKYHNFDVMMHMAYSCAQIPKEKPLVRLATLLHDVGKPATAEQDPKYKEECYTFHNHEYVGAEMSQSIMRRLRFSSDDEEFVVKLVRHHMFMYSSEMRDGSIKRLLNAVGLELLDDLVLLKWADRNGKGRGDVAFNPQTGLRRRVDTILKEEQAFKLRDMKLNGHDLMNELGIKPGPDIGKVLRSLFEEVLDDAALNNRDKLLSKAKELITS